MSDINQADPKRSGTYRAALAAVIFLSVLLVLGVIALVAGLARQYSLYRANQPAATTAAASLVLAPGAHILSATTDSGKLVLHIQTPEGSEVEILDLTTGRLTARVQDGPK